MYNILINTNILALMQSKKILIFSIKIYLFIFLCLSLFFLDISEMISMNNTLEDHTFYLVEDRTLKHF